MDRPPDYRISPAQLRALLGEKTNVYREIAKIKQTYRIKAKLCGVPLSVVCDYYGFNREWLEEYFMKGEES